MSKRIPAMLYICIFATLAQGQPLADNQNNYLPNTIILPFHLHHHLIFIEAEIMGKNGTFLFDSGAPGMVLNKAGALIEDTHPLTDTIAATGVNGKINGIDKVSIQTFKLDKLQLYNLTAMCIDLTHIEKETGQIIAGLIGYDVFKDYEITYDYMKRWIILRKTDDRGYYLEQSDINTSPVCEVPIEIKYHIPIVNVKIGVKEYRMGIDCGATENLLYRKYLPEIEPLTSILTQSKLTGADKSIQNVVSASIARGSICSVAFLNANTTFSNESLDQLNSAYTLGIDGLIGYEYLKQHKISINFKRKTLQIY